MIHKPGLVQFSGLVSFVKSESNSVVSERLDRAPGSPLQVSESRTAQFKSTRDSGTTQTRSKFGRNMALFPVQCLGE